MYNLKKCYIVNECLVYFNKMYINRLKKTFIGTIKQEQIWE